MYKITLDYSRSCAELASNSAKPDPGRATTSISGVTQAGDSPVRWGRGGVRGGS